MTLETLRDHWNHFGSEDPLFAVLTDPEKRGGKWDEESFYATGREEIAHLLSVLEAAGLPHRRGRALDFGCGAGRLSQALAEHFERVSGIDIAPSMIEVAERNNRHAERVTYHLNGSDTLPFETGSFDFVYSNYVLQHIEPVYAKRYVAEFLRVLAEGGLAVFQFTSAPRALGKRLIAKGLPAFALKAYRRLRFGKHFMEMHGVPVEEVERIVAESGGRVLRLDRVEADVNWQSHVCYATKGAAPDAAASPIPAPR